MSVDVKRRYFNLTGSLHEIAKNWKETVWVDHKRQLKAFCERVGTSDMMVSGVRILAIEDVGKEVLGSRPSKRFDGFWEPNLRTKAGKDLAKELKSLQTPRCEPLFKIIASGEPWFVEGYMTWTGLSSYGDVYIVSIPKEMEYTPHPEMVELKEWEFLKLKDDYQTAQAKTETAA